MAKRKTLGEGIEEKQKNTFSVVLCIFFSGIKVLDTYTTYTCSVYSTDSLPKAQLYRAAEYIMFMFFRGGLRSTTQATIVGGSVSMLQPSKDKFRVVVTTAVCCDWKVLVCTSIEAEYATTLWF